MAKFNCALCGSELESYPCPLCGYNGEMEQRAADLTQKHARVRPAEPAASGSRPAAPRPRPAAPVKKKKRRKKKRGPNLVLILAIVLLAALLGLGITVFLTVHSWRPAACTAPETCAICGKTRGEALPHSWVGNGCTSLGTCSVCGKVQDQPDGHRWLRPDCLTAGSCSICGAAEEQAPGHDWAEASCDLPMICTRCAAVSGKALGHSWDGSSKAVCSRCRKDLTLDEQAEILLELAAERIAAQQFTSPDWAALYKKAGIQDSRFESAAEYAVSMAGKSGVPEVMALPRIPGEDPEYIVMLGQDRIAELSLKRVSASSPNWELGRLDLLIDRPVTVTVCTASGSSVLINGVRLGDSDIVRRSESLAAQYLPEGTPGLETWTWQAANLMLEPQIQAAGPDGRPVELYQDPATGIWLEKAAASDSVTDAERQLVFSALESYAGFMINAAGGRGGVMKYFENGTQICQDILLMGGELWMNSDHGHSFRDETISFCRRYSDTIFAVQASLVMDTKLKDGGSRDYRVSQTMFFRQKNGSWACYGMTNRDLLLPAAPAAAGDEWANCPDGIRIESCSGANFNAHVMLIRDPSRVYLGLSSYSGFATSVPGKRLTQAIVDENAAAAVNAGAFNDNGTADLTVGSIPAGLTIYEGKKVSNQNKGMVPEKGFCGLTFSGQLVVADSMTEEEAAAQGIRYGCEFGPVLIRNGQINEEAYKKGGYNPRTVVAQRADGTILFVCADGRQAGSLGATYADMIELLLEYGAVNACNMDGGSSTVMLTKDSSGEVKFINSYSVLQSVPRRMPTFWMVRGN